MGRLTELRGRCWRELVSAKAQQGFSASSQIRGTRRLVWPEGFMNYLVIKKGTVLAGFRKTTELLFSSEFVYFLWF